MTLHAVSVSLVCLASFAISIQAEDNRTRPLWTGDLNTSSYGARPDPRYIGGKAYIGGKFTDIGVLFRGSASDEVLCYFVTKADAGQLAHRGKLETSDPFRLQLISFDAKTGSLKYRKEMPARSGLSSVMVNDEGNFIIRTGEFLKLYRNDFSVSNERQLSVNGEYDKWSVRISPTGKTLLLDHYSPSVSQDEVLSSSSLSVLAVSQRGALFPTFAISDSSVVKPGPQEKGILIRHFEGSWQTLSTSTSFSCVSNPVFINNKELLNACGREVVLLNVGGDVLMRDAVEKNEHLEQLVSVTPDGRFFAVSALQTKGGFMDYTSIKRRRTRILIYDTALRKRISSVEVEPVPRRDYDFALAPDGGKIAMMVDNYLRVYLINHQKIP